ncbi:hypothetical protein C1E24_18635 [Pseudoalteromonas phenolica]|uniref:Uncharacterized protein n=1 Tax=Pseudoalteromonas phenolica TaxID=161398 RepID=A0A5R9PYL5_9GAMM|nr:hypothetical protein [Pseudoalteromonas phenolica]TLX45482.1 hypothetical protein C1E24_18635 [Pseudoalteromonas phenolica]
MSREYKYQNETGTKIGKWYLNRLDYFEFYGFPGLWKIKAKCLVYLGLSIWLIKLLPIFFAPILVWVAYVSVRTFVILIEKKCCYRGYFLFPKKIIDFFREYRKNVDVTDFDSLATVEKAGQGSKIAKQSLTQKFKG